MSDRVFAIVSVYDHAELLPHFLLHYANLGVQRTLVVIRTSNQGEVFEQARQDAGLFPAEVYWVACDRFADSDKSEVEQSILHQNDVQADDYVMHLDLDEFQEYPVPLPEIVRLMNQRNDWAIQGWILDRVAGDGTLRAVRSTPSIGEQFPIGCAVTEALLGACIRKIVLCRGRVKLKWGVRHDTENAYYDAVPIGRTDQYVVHHFKWLDGLVPRLQARLERAALGSDYSQECRRFIAYWQEHGRFDLTTPSLRAKWLGALNYPTVVSRIPESVP